MAQIMAPAISKTTVTSNLVSAKHRQIEANITSPHGATLLGITMLDSMNVDLWITIETNDAVQLDNMFSYVLRAARNAKTTLHSYEDNGFVLEEYKGTQLKTPDAPKDFDKADTVLDITSKIDAGFLVEMRFYKRFEQRPRVLKLIHRI